MLFLEITFVLQHVAEVLSLYLPFFQAEYKKIHNLNFCFQSRWSDKLESRFYLQIYIKQ